MKRWIPAPMLLGALVLGGVSGPAFAEPGDEDIYRLTHPDEVEQNAQPADEAQPSTSGSTSAGAQDAAPGKILIAPIPAVSGPKRTVAVGKFTATGAFTAKYGNWDVGGGMAAMLTSALVESNRFIVVERAGLQNILSEQQLKGAGLTNPTTGPSRGKLIGVQMLIFGAVTEFGDSDEGGGFSIGGSGGGIGNLLSGALSRQSATGTVAIDVRLVDTTSGQVLETHTIREEIESSGWDLSGGFKGISLGTNQFYKTPLGQAARSVITKAVQRIAVQAENTAWSGQVVDFDGKEVYINAGARSGLHVGDKFMVERVVKRLTDPTTNEVLSIRKKELGVLQITGVEKKISYGQFAPLGMEPPQRGDYVAMMH